MSRHTSALALAALVVVSLVACSGGDKAMGPTSPSDPSDPTRQRTAIKVTNASAMRVTHLLTRACGSQLYAEQASAPIQPGETLTKDLAPGCYDVGLVAEGTDGDRHAHLDKQTLQANQTLALKATGGQFHDSNTHNAGCVMHNASSAMLTDGSAFIVGELALPADDQAFKAEANAQLAFWGVGWPVYLAYELNPNAEAVPDGRPLGLSTGYVVFGVNFFTIHNRAHGMNAVDALLAHENGHTVQMTQPWGSALFASYPTAITELEADAFSGYYMALNKNMNWDELNMLYQHFCSTGDTDFANPKHHGTCWQRETGAYIGLYAAYLEQKDNGGVHYSYQQLHEYWMNLILKDIWPYPYGPSSQLAPRSQEVATMLAQTPRRLLREMSTGKSRGPVGVERTRRLRRPPGVKQSP